MCLLLWKEGEIRPQNKGQEIIIDLDGARSGPNGLKKCLDLEALKDEDEMDANMVNVTEKSKA